MNVHHLHVTTPAPTQSAALNAPVMMAMNLVVMEDHVTVSLIYT